MKYDVFTAVKRGFVMLLIHLKSCKIGECEKVDEEIKKLIVIVKRDKRENVVNFDRETIFAHNIGFFDIVNEKTDKKIDETNEEIDEKSETNEVNEVDETSFFVCFVRT